MKELIRRVLDDSLRESIAKEKTRIRVKDSSFRFYAGDIDSLVEKALEYKQKVKDGELPFNANWGSILIEETRLETDEEYAARFNEYVKSAKKAVAAAQLNLDNVKYEAKVNIATDEYKIATAVDKLKKAQQYYQEQLKKYGQNC